MTWCGGTDIGDRLSESQMTFDKVFHGVLDQGHGCLLIFEEQEADLRRPYVVYQIVVYEDADLRASQRMVPRLSRSRSRKRSCRRTALSGASPIAVHHSGVYRLYN